jgi:hypothetical protein
MGWYGGQDGARRLRFRDDVSQSFRRFRASLPKTCDVKDLASSCLKDNDDFSTIKLLVHNPSIQQEIIEQVNITQGDSVAVAIASSWMAPPGLMRRLGWSLWEDQGSLFVRRYKVEQGISQGIHSSLPVHSCFGFGRIRRLGFQFCPVALWRQALDQPDFLGGIRRAQRGRQGYSVRTHAKKKLVVRSLFADISNDGFGKLVEAGGGRELVALAASVKKSDKMSTLLTKNFLMVTLPKFVAGEARESKLEHISLGKKVASAAERAKQAQLELYKQPFAVVPVEHMTYGQLKQALMNRGIKPPHLSSAVNFRAALGQAGFTLEEERAIQEKKKLESVGDNKKASGSSSRAGSKRPLSCVN